MLKTLTIPLCFTVLLHTVIVAAFVIDWRGDSRELRRDIPKYVTAKLVVMEKPEAKPKPQPKAKPQPKPQPKPNPKPAAKPKPQPDLAQQQAAKAELEKQRQQQELAEQQARLQALAEQELAEALAAEQAQQQAHSDQQLAASYVAVIKAAIQRNWSRPPSARNNMEVELVIDLVPTGEVVNAAVARSSGDAAFDRSAIAAVKKAAVFPELRQLESRIFEQNFRRFRMIFRPEDLRR